MNHKTYFVYENQDDTLFISEQEPVEKENTHTSTLIGTATNRKEAEKIVAYHQSVNLAKKANTYKEGSIYIHEFFGDFWEGDKNHQIEVPFPTKHTTPLSAKHDSSSLRFEKMGEHIVLVVWSSWHQGFNSKGDWEEHVLGNPIEIIRWEDWDRYKISVVRPEIEGGFGSDATKDYLPCAVNWDELFDAKNKNDNWASTVESLAYNVFTYVNV